MIIGFNERLEKVLLDYADSGKDTDWADVMTAIVNSVAADDVWQIPVDSVEDGMNETDYEAGRTLDNFPQLLKRTVCTRAGKELACAFTSAEKIHVDGTEDAVVCLPYPAKEILAEFAQCDYLDSLILNPWTDGFTISREDAEKALEFAQSVPERRKQSFRSYRIEPKVIIDTNSILESWKTGWIDEGTEQENWRLQCYPIMPDGRVLLLFEMEDEIYAGNYDTFHVESTHSHFRVLEFGMADGHMEQIGKYRFMAQNASIGTVFLTDQKLRSSIRIRNRNAYSIISHIPSDDEQQFSVYSNIERMITDSRGNIIAAYNKNLLDKDHLPVAVFGKEGKIDNAYHDKYALSCLDVNLDHDENVWFHLYPSNSLDRLGENGIITDSHHVALPGFSSFALSDDLSRLFVSLSEYQGGSMQYILHKDKNGNYTKPIRFEFNPTDENGEELTAKNCKVFGRCSSMKSWVVLNADGKLYLYDINDCID